MKITLIFFTTLILGSLSIINNLNSCMFYNLTLIELHDRILYYLVLILFAVGWVLFSVIYNYITNKSHISHKYLNDGTLIESIWTILPAVILMLTSFHAFQTLYLMDDVNNLSPSVLNEIYSSHPSPDFFDYISESNEFDSYLVPESGLMSEEPKSIVRQIFGIFDVIINPSDYTEIKSCFQGSKNTFIKPLTENSSLILNEINKMNQEENIDMYRDMAEFMDWDPYYWYPNEWSTMPRLNENHLNDLKETKAELIRRTKKDGELLMWWDLKGSYGELQELANQLKLYWRGNRRNLEMYDIITEYLRTPNNILIRYEENMRLTREIGSLLRNQEELNQL